MKKILLILLAGLTIGMLSACGDKPLPEDALSYEQAASSPEVTYSDGNAVVILIVDQGLEWNCEVADASKIEVISDYVLKPKSVSAGKTYQVWVLDGKEASTEEVLVRFYKTDKNGNTGYSGSRTFAFIVAPDLALSMKWGRLEVKS